MVPKHVINLILVDDDILPGLVICAGIDATPIEAFHALCRAIEAANFETNLDGITYSSLNKVMGAPSSHCSPKYTSTKPVHGWLDSSG